MIGTIPGMSTYSKFMLQLHIKVIVAARWLPPVWHEMNSYDKALMERNEGRGGIGGLERLLV